MRALILSEELKKLLGVLPDTQLAKQFGINAETIRAHRRELGIESPFAMSAPYAWSDSALALLGKDSDASVARRLGIAKDLVMRKRRTLGIPSFGKSGGKTQFSAPMLEMLGKHTDRAIAEQFGIGEKTVSLMRRSLKIPPQRVIPRIDWNSKDLGLLKTVGTTALAKKWGVSVAAIFNQRRKLRVPSPPLKGRARWSQKMESLLGTAYDSAVARTLGLTIAQVTARRRKMKIRAARRMWNDEDLKVLGTVPDAEAARTLGISPHAAAAKRIKLGIPAYARARWSKTVLDLIGKRPDEEIAKMCGCRPHTVRDRRIAMGIKPCPREDPRPPGTLTCSDIAAKYGVTMRRVQAWRMAGLPCQKIGSMIVVKKYDLGKWVRRGAHLKTPMTVQKSSANSGLPVTMASARVDEGRRSSSMATNKLRRRGAGPIDVKAAAACGIHVSAESASPAQFLSPNEIGEMMNVTGEAVKHWIRQRQLPATRLANGYWKVSVADLDAFLKRRTGGNKRRAVITYTREGTMDDVMVVVNGLGYQPVVVHTYADALLKSGGGQYPSLFILNLAVGDMEVWKLAETIRTTATLKNCQILMMGELDLSDADTERALRLSIQGFLKRPVAGATLLSEIERVLGQMSVRRRKKF